MNRLIGICLTALIAAISSVICARLGIAVWIMFIGWIAFAAGGASARSAPITFICVALGVLLGMFGASVIDQGAAMLGADVSLLIGVFIIVGAALLMQFVPAIGSVLGCFVGMTTFFASGLSPSLTSLAMIATGIAIGIASGFWLEPSQPLWRRKARQCARAASSCARR